MHTLLFLHEQIGSIQKFTRLFEQDYICLRATSIIEALSLLELHDVAVIVSEQRLSTSEFLRASLDLRPSVVQLQLSQRPDIDELISSLNSGLVHFHLHTPVANEELRLMVHRAVSKFDEHKRLQALSATNARLQLRMRQSKLSLVRSLGAILRVRDGFVHARGLRISQFADFLAGEFMLNEELREDLTAAAMLHEISIFTATETTDLNLRSAHSLSCFPELLDASDIVRFQYENFDGTGRPGRLQGEQIPIASRILRVAGEYDGLTHPREAALALSHEEAIKDLRSQAGKWFDGRVVEALSFVEFKEQDGYTQPVRTLEAEAISQAIH
ncbi:MAG TPA: HD domain-containing phosphohydrolase [Pyrinomonadaceae bacterium]